MTNSTSNNIVNRQEHGSIIGQSATNMQALIIESVISQRGIDKQTGDVSNKLLVCARVYQKHDTIGVTSEGNSDSFIDACKLHEDYIKSNEARDNKVDKLPRCWTQAKSNIKAALNYGIDLSKYESESALRKDVIKARGKKDKNPVTAQLGEFKKSMESMPEEQALAILKQVDSLVKEALASLVPVVPIKAEVSTTTNPESQGSTTGVDCTVLMSNLDIDAALAAVIIEAGFSSLDDIIETGELLAELPEIDDELASELVDRAVTAQLTEEFKEVA